MSTCSCGFVSVNGRIHILYRTSGFLWRDMTDETVFQVSLSGASPKIGTDFVVLSGGKRSHGQNQVELVPLEAESARSGYRKEDLYL